MSRRLGVDRLNETAKKFGLGAKVFDNAYNEEKKGLFPSTKWKKNNLGKGWVLGETLITGIGQGYVQSTPLQLCLMTAQLANGGFKIRPKIIVSKDDHDYEYIKNKMEQNFEEKMKGPEQDDALVDFGHFQKDELYKPLFRNRENVKFVLDSIFASTNEVRGTSYGSRINDKKYQFAGKTGTSQVKKITEIQRELDLDISQIPYNERDHALYVAFGPYKNPRYAMSIFIEHGGSGSSAAAPLAKKLFKVIIDRHEEREKIRINDKLNTNV